MKKETKLLPPEKRPKLKPATINIIDAYRKSVRKLGSEESRMLTTKEQWALRADLKKKATWAKKQKWERRINNGHTKTR